MQIADPRAERRTILLAAASACVQAVVLFGVGLAHLDVDPFDYFPARKTSGDFDPNVFVNAVPLLFWDVGVPCVVGAVAAAAAGRFLARLPRRLTTGQLLVYAWALPYALFIALASLTPEGNRSFIIMTGAGFIFGPPLAAAAALAGFLTAPTRPESPPESS